MAHCPSMTMIDGGLPGGPPPIRAMLDAGVNVGIGCDGATAADHQSLWLETKMAMLLSRQREGRATAMSARNALRMATRGGARALGREGEIGQLAVGANADISVWRMDTLPYAGVLNDPLTGLMHGGQPRPGTPSSADASWSGMVNSSRLTFPRRWLVIAWLRNGSSSVVSGDSGRACSVPWAGRWHVERDSNSNPLMPFRTVRSRRRQPEIRSAVGISNANDSDG